jgi:hypothetical protein
MDSRAASDPHCSVVEGVRDARHQPEAPRQPGGVIARALPKLLYKLQGRPNRKLKTPISAVFQSAISPFKTSSQVGFVKPRVSAGFRGFERFERLNCLGR